MKKSKDQQVSEEYISHIINRIKSGESDAFSDLVDTYKDFVFALCFKMTQSIEDAEEITQDTFVKVFKNIKTFKGQSKFSTWLYRIAYFTTINFLRKNRVKTVSQTELFETRIEPIDEDESALKNISQAERSHYINKALNFLKPQERAVIVLFYLEEHSIEEIATITKLSKSNTKVKIHRTRKKLHEILNHLLKNEIHSLV